MVRSDIYATQRIDNSFPDQVISETLTSQAPSERSEDGEDTVQKVLKTHHKPKVNTQLREFAWNTTR